MKSGKKIVKVSNSLLAGRSVKAGKSAKASTEENMDTASDSTTSTRVIKAPRASTDKVNLTAKYAVYDPTENTSETVEVASASSHSIISMKSHRFPMILSVICISLPASESLLQTSPVIQANSARYHGDGASISYCHIPLPPNVTAAWSPFGCTEVEETGSGTAWVFILLCL